MGSQADFRRRSLLQLPWAPAAVVVRLVALLILVGAGVRFSQAWQGTLPRPPVELSLHAYSPENGGWVGEALRVESGRHVRLHVHTVEGAHGLRIAHTDIESELLIPGPTQVIEFTAPAPGRYILYCTVWCGLNHWRMRTVLEVFDPDAPDAPLQYVQDPPRYHPAPAPFDIDAAHPATVWPTQAVDVQQGRALWQQLEPEADPAGVLSDLGWPLVSPSDAFLALETGQSLAGAVDAGDAEIWALLGFLWEAQTTPAALERGAAIYAANCASCHGVDGSGNGFEAMESPSPVPDLRYAPMAAGASPLQYYAKTARGGMGTGMPNWGTVLGEDDLWAVAEYLYTFLFGDPVVDAERAPPSEHR